MFTSLHTLQYEQVREIPSIWPSFLNNFCYLSSTFPSRVISQEDTAPQCESLWIRASAKCYICKYKYIMVCWVMQIALALEYSINQTCYWSRKLQKYVNTNRPWRTWWRCCYTALQYKTVALKSYILHACRKRVEESAVESLIRFPLNHCLIIYSKTWEK